MAQAVGTIKSIQGSAVATSPNGEVRVLQAGDTVFMGEVVTSQSTDGKVSISLLSGREITIEGKEILALDRSVIENESFTNDETNIAQNSVRDLQQSILQGENLDNLGETAAGNGGSAMLSEATFLNVENQSNIYANQSTPSSESSANGFTLIPPSNANQGVIINVIVNAPENVASNTPTITGTTDAVAGSNVVVVVTDNAGNSQTINTVVDQNGSFSVEVPNPIQSGTFTATATVTDPNGNIGTGTDFGSTDTTAPSAPEVSIIDDGNGVLDKEEVDAGVKVKITLPSDASVGDTLHVDTDNDGIDDVTKVLTQEDLNNGVVIDVPREDVPQKGVLTVDATVSDSLGNTSVKGTDTINVDSQVPNDGFAPKVELTQDENNDGFINKNEIKNDNEIDVKVSFNGDKVDVGDIVVITDKNTTKQIPISQDDKTNGFVTTTFDKPAEGTNIVVTSTIKDSSGNESGEGKDSAKLDTSDMKASDIVDVITTDKDDNKLISIDELQNDGDVIKVQITLPSNVSAGDKLTVTGTANPDKEVILTQPQINAGKVSLEFTAPNNGVTFKTTAQVKDAAGNESNIATDEATLQLNKPDAPEVKITEDSNNDGFINSQELNGEVDVLVKVPQNSQLGSTLNIKDNFGHTKEVNVTQDVLDNGVKTSFPAPENGQTITITAQVEDKAGNVSPEGNSSAKIDTSDLTTGLGIEITEDKNNDGYINITELEGNDIDVKVTLPKDAAATDVLTVTGSANVDKTIILSQDDINSGFVNVKFTTVPSDGSDFITTATIKDQAGNITNPPVSDKANMQLSTAGKPLVTIDEDSDANGYINIKELNGSDTLHVSTSIPSTANVGDTMILHVNTPNVEDKKVVLSLSDIQKGSVSFTTPNPGDGKTLQAQAWVVDKAGNVGDKGESNATIDLTAPSQPSVILSDDKNDDGFINKEEYEKDGNDKIDVKVEFNDDVQVGDKIIITSNIDSQKEITITPEDKTNGFVQTTMPTPNDGINIKVDAIVEDKAGNQSLKASDQAMLDRSDLNEAGGEISVKILDDSNDDKLISKTELGEDNKIQVEVTLPKNAVAGDTLIVTGTGTGVAVGKDGGALKLTDADIQNGKVVVDFNAPSHGVEFVTTAQVVDIAQNKSNIATDSAVIDLNAPQSPRVEILTGDDELLNAKEISDGVHAKITLLPDTKVGDKLLVDTNNDGKPDQIFTVSKDDLKDGIDVLIDPSHVPANGELVVKASVVDEAGNESDKGEASANTDSDAPSKPEVLIEGGDNLLSAKQIADGVSVDITIPQDAKKGDLLLVNVVGKDKPIEITLLQSQIDNQKVSIVLGTNDVPADGMLVVKATITDKAGNVSEEGKDNALADSTAPTKPIVNIIDSDNNDVLNAQEIQAGVKAKITFIDGVKAGDVLHVDTNGDGVDDFTYTLKDTDIKNGLEIDVDKNHVPNNGTLTITATITDLAGNVSLPGADSIKTNSTPAGAPEVSIQDTDGLLNAQEVDEGVKVKITFPDTVKAGDVLHVDTNGDGTFDTDKVLSDSDIKNGVQIDVPAEHVPNDGILSVKARVEDANKNMSPQGEDSSKVDKDAPSAPSVEIANGDDLLNASEIENGVRVKITIPQDAQPGDKLHVIVKDGAAIDPITLTSADIKNGVSITVPKDSIPSDGVLEVKANITDKAGNAGDFGKDEATTDSTAPIAPNVHVNSGEDDILNAQEIANGVTASIDVSKAEVGDTLHVDTNNDKVYDFSKELSKADIANGVNVNVSDVPNNGKVVVNATIADKAGNISEVGSDDASIDKLAPANPIVVIQDHLDNNDGSLNASEVANGVTAKISVNGAEVGDTLKVDTNNDGEIDIIHVISQSDINNGFDAPIPASQIPAQGTLTVSATITDKAGNESGKGVDSTNVDTSDFSNISVSITEDTDNNGVINLSEFKDNDIDVRVTLPTNAQGEVSAKAGDTLVVEASANSNINRPLTEQEVTNGYVDLKFNAPTNGNTFQVSASIIDPAGNVSPKATDSARMEVEAPKNAQVNIDEDNQPKDGYINASELDGNINISVTLPATAQIGDTVYVDFNNDGTSDSFKVITPEDKQKNSIGFEMPTPNPHEGVTINPHAWVVDQYGNVGNKTDATAIIDTQAPVITINAPQNSETSTPTITGTIDEPVGTKLQITVVDKDGNSQTATLTSTQDPNNPNGSVFEYTPTQSIPDGTYSVSVTASDAAKNQGSAQANGSVDVNDAPVANDDVANVTEDIVKTGNVLDNDTDADVNDVLKVTKFTIDANGDGKEQTFNAGDSVNITKADGTAIGTLSIASNGDYRFSPAPDYNGEAPSATYTVSDEGGLEDSAKLILGPIASASDTPSLVDDKATTNEDTRVIVDVLQNDTDADGDILSIVKVSGVDISKNDPVILSDGTKVELTSDNKLAITPPLNFNGDLNLTYTATDGQTPVSANLVLHINPVNDAPVANADNTNTAEDTPVVVDVLQNDTDVDSTNLSIVKVAGQSISTSTPVMLSDGTKVELTNDNKLKVTPVSNSDETIRFNYTISDGEIESKPAEVTIVVGGVNDTPVANNDTNSTNEDTTLNVDKAQGVLANDTDADNDSLVVNSVLFNATSGAVGTPLNGTYGTLTLNADGSYKYVPNAHAQSLKAGEEVTDTFTYTAKDPSSAISSPATLTLTLTGVNDAPVAINHGKTTTFNQPVSINLLEGASDVENDTLNVAKIANQDVNVGDVVSITDSAGNEQGKATLGENGIITFTPKAGAEGLVQFSYTISDGDKTDTKSVAITIGDNKAPNAVEDVVNVDENHTVNFDLLSNDSDEDGLLSDLHVTKINNQSIQPNGSVTLDEGTISMKENGQLTFTPKTDFSGDVNFNYTVADKFGASSSTTAVIHVKELKVGGIEHGNSSDTVEEGNTINYVVNITNAPAQEIQVNLQLTPAQTNGVDFANGKDVTSIKVSGDNGKTWQDVSLDSEGKFNATLSSGVSKVLVNVNTNDDDIVELKEGMVLKASLGDITDKSTSSNAFITDNDKFEIAQGENGIVATNGAEMADNSKPIGFEINFNKEASTDQNVKLTLSGDGANPATIGTDTTTVQVSNDGKTWTQAQLQNGSVDAVVEAGSKKLYVKVGINDDNIKEQTESVKLTAQVGKQEVSKIATIADNDSIGIADNGVVAHNGAEENSVAITYDINLTNTSSSDTVVTLKLESAQENGATLGTDTALPIQVSTDGNTWTNVVVDSNGNFTASIPAGKQSLHVKVPVVDDNIDEADEGLVLSAKVGTQEWVSATASIIDNDSTKIQDGENAITATNGAEQGSKAIEYSVNFTNPSSEAKEVSLNLVPTATNGVTLGTDTSTIEVSGDNGKTWQTVTLDNNGDFTATLQPSFTNIKVKVGVVDDNIDEANEGLKLTAKLGTQTASKEALIIDNDDTQIISGDNGITIIDGKEEGSEDIQYSVNFTNQASADKEVTLSLTPTTNNGVTLGTDTNTIKVSGDNGTTWSEVKLDSNGSFTTNLKAGSDKVLVKVGVVDDNITEAKEGLSLSAKLANQDAVSKTGYIIDNDSTKILDGENAITATNGAEQGSKAIEYSVNFTNPSSEATQVSLNLVPTATNGVTLGTDTSTIEVSGDNGKTWQTVTLDNNGDFTATLQPSFTNIKVKVGVVDDNIDEANEGLKLTAKLGTQTASKEAVIIDNDSAQLADNGISVSDGAEQGSKPIVYTINFTNEVSSQKAVNVTLSPTSDNGVTLGTDTKKVLVSGDGGKTYNEVTLKDGAFTANLEAGNSKILVKVEVVDDSIDEVKEGLNISATFNGKTITGVGYIEDNDQTPTIDTSLSKLSADVYEDGLNGGIKEASSELATANDGKIVIADTPNSNISIAWDTNTDNSPKVTDASGKALTHNGVALEWSISGSDIVGKAGNEKVISLHVNDVKEVNGKYEATYTTSLHKTLDHHEQGEDNIALNLGIKISDGTNSSTSTITVNVHDDMPTAFSKDAVESTVTLQPSKTNLMITLDLSDSMLNQSGVGNKTRLDLAKESTIELIKQYSNYDNDLHVNIVVFNGLAGSKGWKSASEAITYIQNIGTSISEIHKTVQDTLGENAANAKGGLTNYDAALAKTMSEFGTLPSGHENANKVSYFVTDGKPGIGNANDTAGEKLDNTVYIGGYKDVKKDAGISEHEQKQWTDFLNENKIDSIAIGVTKDVAVENINPIAHNGQSGADKDGIVVENLSELKQTVLDNISVAPIEGKLINYEGDKTINHFAGADGAKSFSVTIEGKTYTLNVADNKITSDNADATIQDQTIKLSTNAGSDLSINLSTGEYVYTASKTVSSSGHSEKLNISYTITDKDGDTSTGTNVYNFTSGVKGVENVVPVAHNGEVHFDTENFIYISSLAGKNNANGLEIEKIYKVNLDTGDKEAVFSSSDAKMYIGDIATANDGKIYAVNFFGQGEIYLINPKTNSIESTYTLSLGNKIYNVDDNGVQSKQTLQLNALEISNDGKTLYIGSPDSNKLYSIGVSELSTPNAPLHVVATMPDKLQGDMAIDGNTLYISVKNKGTTESEIYKYELDSNGSLVKDSDGEAKHEKIAAYADSIVGLTVNKGHLYAVNEAYTRPDAPTKNLFEVNLQTGKKQGEMLVTIPQDNAILQKVLSGAAQADGDVKEVTFSLKDFVSDSSDETSLHVKFTQLPENGKLYANNELVGTENSDVYGKDTVFKFVPTSDAEGSFKYVAIDSHDAQSQEATVSLSVKSGLDTTSSVHHEIADMNDLHSISGTNSHDSVLINQSGVIDLSKIAKISTSIEEIDLGKQNASATELKVSIQDVLDMTNDNHSLVIQGDKQDKVTLEGGSESWSKGATTDEYVTYSAKDSSGVELKVHQDVVVDL